MKVFVINLEKNVARMRHMDEQLKDLHIGYERVEAVYGAGLSDIERNRSFNSLRSYLCEGYRLSAGEVGCALSHLSVYRRLSEDDVACVLEDDVILGNSFVKVLKDVSGIVDIRSPQVFILSAHGVSKGIQDGFHRVYDAMCTDGYVITGRAARIILKSNYPVVSVADRWKKWVRRHGLELYQCMPGVVKQDNDAFGSDIRDLSRARCSGLRLVVHRCCRSVCLTIEWCIYKMKGW